MRYIVLAVAAALSASCARQSAVPMPKAIVDLSSPLAEDTPVKQVGAKFLKDFHYRETTKFEHNVMEDPLFVQDSYITLLNHVGPHVDPPNHMIKGAQSVDRIPLDKLMGAARIFDFRAKPKDSPLMKADFEGKGIAAGEIVIAFVGYTPPTGPDEMPSYAYLSGEAAEYLASIPIRAFASDMPSLGSIRRYPALMASGVKGSDKLAPEHYAFLSREIPNIEGLTNLESIVGKPNVVFVGFPLKIKDGNGAPMRAAALLY